MKEQSGPHPSKQTAYLSGEVVRALLHPKPWEAKGTSHSVEQRPLSGSCELCLSVFRALDRPR